MNNKRRGWYGEYKLMTLLKKAGFFVMRAPASGSKVKRFDYVDVIAIKKGLILLFEVKRRIKKDTIEITKEQIDKLKRARELTEGQAYISVYIDDEKRWYFFTLEQLEFKNDHYLLSAYEYQNAMTIEKIYF